MFVGLVPKELSRDRFASEVRGQRTDVRGPIAGNRKKQAPGSFRLSFALCFLTSDL